MYPYIHIFERSIPTYSLCILVAIAVVYLFSASDCKKKSLSIYDLIIMATVAVFTGLFCAALLYIIVTYPPKVLFSMIKTGDYSFLEGGLVFYGGLIGGIIGAFLGKRIANCRFYDYESCVIPYLPLGHAIGRIGCLLGGCCYGFEYSGPLAIHYNNSITDLQAHQGYFPTPLLECCLNLCICGILLKIRKRKLAPGKLLATYLLLYGVVRIFTEMFRGDAARGIFLNISTSQWISIALIIVSTSYLIFGKKKNK